MYRCQKENTKKQKAYEFYNSFEWDKVSWPTFYYRVRLWWEETWEENIRVKAKNQYHRRDNTPKGKRAKEMIRYSQQPEPRASKTLFRNRLNGGYPKEKAILIWNEWLQTRKERQIAHPIVAKPYTPKPKVIAQVDENNFKINVTLSKEEANVFRKEYIKMIEDIEWELTYTDEKTEVAGLNKKLAQLQEELQTFNLYNPK